MTLEIEVYPPVNGNQYVMLGGRLDTLSHAQLDEALAPHGGKVLLVNPQPQIQKVLDMVKAVPLNEIFSSTAEADAYLDLMQRRVLEAGEDED